MIVAKDISKTDMQNQVSNKAWSVEFKAKLKREKNCFLIFFLLL